MLLDYFRRELFFCQAEGEFTTTTMFKPNPLPTQERLKELLDYDPETGLLTWKVSRGRVKPGTVAGTVTLKGYLRLKVDKSKFTAQRLIWMIAYGEDPCDSEVDHKDGVRDNNRLSNLRLSSHRQNQHNQHSAKGYYWDKCHDKWKSAIQVCGRKLFIGRYDTEEEARKNYLTVKDVLHPTHLVT